MGVLESFSLRGHAALVTGASSGIGAATAFAYAEAGADLALTARAGPELDRTADRCREAGAAVAVLPADLADGKVDYATLVARAFDAQPSLDIVFSNAGAFFDVPYLDMTPDRFDATVHLNIRAGYFLVQEACRRWVASAVRGRVVFCGSVNALLAEPGSTAYDMSKAALHALVRGICVDLAPSGIRVNGIAPGLIRTGATRWLESQPSRARWAVLHTPNGQIPDADSCAAAATFLVSDGADHVQGHVLGVDGGLGALQFPARPADVDDVLDRG